MLLTLLYRFFVGSRVTPYWLVASIARVGGQVCQATRIGAHAGSCQALRPATGRVAPATHLLAGHARPRSIRSGVSHV